MTDTMEIVRGK